MASAELQAIKENLMQFKRQMAAGVTIPAEAIADLRASNDATVMLPYDHPVLSGVRCEEGELGGTAGEWARVADEPTKKVLLYFHGGGYENGTVKSRRLASMGIAKVAGIDSFSLDYTQWPEGRHPVALNEALAAWHELVGRYGAENIYMGGESAGAMLTLATCLWLSDHGEELPAKILCIGPVIDVSEDLPSQERNNDIDPMLSKGINEQIRSHYFEGADPKSPYVSARYGNYEGFPPVMVTVGTEEILYDDACMLHEILKEAGVDSTLRIYEECYHTFQLLPCPEAFASIEELGEFLKD